MTDVFKFEQQEEGERELVLLVGPRGPLPHQRYATHSDIKAALAEKELCVVPKGRHDWVFAEEVMKRDEEIARLTAALTAEQQRRQEVERERDRYRDKKRDAEQREASLADDVDELRAELAACRKVVEAARCFQGKSEFYTDAGPRSIVTVHATALDLRQLDAALASTGKDSGEALGPDGESPPEVSGRCRVCQGRGRELRCRRVETCTACDGTGRQTIGTAIAYGDTVRIRGMHKRCGDLATVIGLYPKGCATVRIHGAEQPRNGEVYPAYPLEDLEKVEPNPSKSSNGSTNPPGIRESSGEPEADPVADLADLQLPWSRRDEGSNTIVNSSDDLVADFYSSADVDHALSRCNAPATVPRGALPEWRITRVRGATAFLREAWEHNDGAEGESVRLVCDELEALLDAGTR